MFTSLLIANRGEIARRIQRTARQMGVRTIAVYSDADQDLPFVRECDEAIRLGSSQASESYLNVAALLQAARQSGAEAIHPGYGFLSENAAFAEAVEAAGLVWVGAPPSAIRAMGLKDAAKTLMAQAGVPVTPGYQGADQSPARLQAAAEAIGFPVLIKAVAGGGGRGMRRVDDTAAFAAALASCQREAAASFGDDRVLIERFIERPRHIEVQVFGDRHGEVVHLFERDCSVQRRHQKIIEEAPAPGLDEATRATICEAAVKAARAVHYVGAGTIEFIADSRDGLRADRIWFMEMNTRLQVEHPVTEAITSVDLVEWQLRVAAGEPLPKRQHELRIAGVAMEARLYAEDPSNGFKPSTGGLVHFKLPETLRVESGFEAGNEVTPFYDAMLAKLISHGATRQQAVRSLADGCKAVEVWPLATNAGFLVRVLGDSDFAGGPVDTTFIETHALERPAEAPEAVRDAAARALLPKPTHNPWTRLTGFRLNAPADDGVDLTINGVPTRGHAGRSVPAVSIISHGPVRVAFWAGEAWPFSPPARSQQAVSQASDGGVRATMPGLVTAVSVKVGDRVAEGQVLLVVEAMKTEHSLVAPFAGRVDALAASVGQQVVQDAVLVRIVKDPA